MANWATVSYVIEGPKNILDKIERASIISLSTPYPWEYRHTIDITADEGWEGNILKLLNIQWKPRQYVRGFISTTPQRDADNVLTLEAQEAWGLTDFRKILTREYPDIKIYYVIEDLEDEIFCTNDKEGKYFIDRYFIDACYEGSYLWEYFQEEEKAYTYLKSHTDGRIKCKEDIDKYNEECENTDNYIHLYKFDVEE